jgi:dinuclear metal center YbgI/SA1388 family protein
MITIADVERMLGDHYPTGSAESWDRVGLVTGDRADELRGILLTVDVTDAVVEQAAELGANLIVAHHPLLLRGINAVDPEHPKGRMIIELIRQRIGLITAHTNADIPVGGVADSLAEALGLRNTRPLRPVPVSPCDMLVTYVPGDHVERVLDALAAAGAGMIGNYDRCAFTASGTGTFRPLDGATPYLGAVGKQEYVAEDRIELVLDRSRRSQVVAALRSAHPYEEPAFQIVEVVQPADSRPLAGLGRIGTVDMISLGDFARQVADVLPSTAGGVRVAGDQHRMIGTVALQAGAGDDLFDVARQAGADVYLTSDLRHHPVSEAIGWPEAPAVIDVSHWAAEWTWLPVLRAELSSLLEVAGGAGIGVTVSEIRTDPWDFVA